MCYTLNAKATIDQLNKKYKAGNETPEVHKVFHKLSGFNAAATAVKDYAKLPVLTATQNDIFTYMQWGLIPSWTPQDKAKSYVINNLNAKSETVFEKKSFAPSLKEKRCIIPVTGFFESREINKEKYPYFIYLKNEAIFSLAGIYDTWKDTASGATIKSFSIITTEANALMAKIHNTKKRMPVILTEENEKKWLAPTISDEEIKYLLQPLDDSLMQAHTVDKKVNNTRIDSDQAEITNLVEYPELAFYE
jgi:putative SOS response-associated peptidase YedK